MLKEITIRFFKLLVGYVLFAVIYTAVIPLVTMLLGRTGADAVGQPIFMGVLILLFFLTSLFAGRKVTSTGSRWADGAVVVFFFVVVVGLSFWSIASRGPLLLGPVMICIYINTKVGTLAAALVVLACAGIMLHGLRRSE